MAVRRPMSAENPMSAPDGRRPPPAKSRLMAARRPPITR